MKKRRRKKKRLKKIKLIVMAVMLLAVIGFFIGYWGYNLLTADETADAVTTEEEPVPQEEETEPEQLLSATVVTQAVSVEEIKVYLSSSTGEREIYKISTGKDGSFKIYAPEIANLVACEISRVDNLPLTPRPEIFWINADGDMVGINRQLLKNGGAVVLKKIEDGVSYKIVLRTEDEAYEVFIQPFL